MFVTPQWAHAAQSATPATTQALWPPTFDSVRAAFCPSDARLLDRHGVVLQEVRLDRTRRRLAWTLLNAVSPALTDAMLASEDRRFWQHGGVDWRAIAAAAWQRLRGGGPRGASTITMQVAALLDPALERRGAPRALADKWAQMRAAWTLERRWSKREILEAYLNLVTYRGELQGIGAASAQLFGKAPHGLTTAESAVLAALVRSPNAPRAALARRAALLAGVDEAPLSSATSGARNVDGDAADAPAAVNALRAAIDRAIDQPAGGAARIALAPHAARRLLRAAEGGSCTDTASTLDADTQRAALDAVRRQLVSLSGRAVRDAAVLVVDNASGAVRAYVGSSGRFSAAPQVDGILARRQAGSTLKPFLYAAAIDQRLLTAAGLLDDAPLELAVGGGLFQPRNYDDHFRGAVSVRTALASSLNIPAVRALQLVGADSFAESLRDLGFGGVDRPGDFYGPSLALGSADVTLWQLVGAYRALANGGTWSPLRMTVPRDTDVVAWDASNVVAWDSSPVHQLGDPAAARWTSWLSPADEAGGSPNWNAGLESHATTSERADEAGGSPNRNAGLESHATTSERTDEAGGSPNWNAGLESHATTSERADEAGGSPNWNAGLESHATTSERADEAGGSPNRNAGLESHATTLESQKSHATTVNVFSPAAAFITADMLADRASRSVTFGLESPLSTRFWTAVKTGTSTDMRDNWCIGFSRRYTVGVWVGNFSGAPMQDVSGITGAAPIWQEVMEWLHRDLPSLAPAPPAGVRAATVTFANGVEAPRDEWFVAGTEPRGAPAARAHTPRLLTPVDGTTVALDPDIPAARQRVTFTAAAGAGLRWRLDGDELAPVSGPLLWPPTAGTHELALVAADGAVVDTSRFVVRP